MTDLQKISHLIKHSTAVCQQQNVLANAVFQYLSLVALR